MQRFVFHQQGPTEGVGAVDLIWQKPRVEALKSAARSGRSQGSLQVVAGGMQV